MQTDTSTRQSHSLIASDRVEGTPVRRSDGGKIGTIERLMIDKLSGNVAYAVLSFGGFFGMGAEHYPVPWSTLKYDEELGGYITPITKDQLKNAPKIGQNDTWEGDKHQAAVIESYYVLVE